MKEKKVDPNIQKPMGRKLKPIDENQVKSLAGINCSYAEMAAVLGCDEKTLSNRFSRAIKEGREVGKMSLKRKQYEVAMGGNVTMLIWLGKITVGQVEQVRQVIDQRNLNINSEVESSAVKEILSDLKSIIDTKTNERKG